MAQQMRGQQEEGPLFWNQLFIKKGGKSYERQIDFSASVLFFVMVGCAPTSHFGVRDKALMVPGEFGQTGAAIASAERSEGAKYCPEKIARAKELGKKGRRRFIGSGHTAEVMALLAEARELAKEAESCRPSPRAEEKVIIPPSEPMAIAPEAKIVILAFKDIHFDFDKSALKPEARTILKRSIQILKDNPEIKVRIAGYTSARGSEDYNKWLSERRANAVRDYLINEGIIAPNRLSIVGYGETRPAMYEAAPSAIYSKAAKANMRVLFEIIV